MSELDDRVRAALEESLLERRDVLRQEISQQGIDPDSDDFNEELERGFADGAHTAAERGQRITLMKELSVNLHDVEAALAKMERGTYGTCERCGNAIDVERLEAIPWARLCMPCKRSEA
jgi:DnaK suppressor protein